MKPVPNEATQQLATNLREPRCLQELLGGAGAEVEEVWRPQTQDPGVDFVPLLGRVGKMQILSNQCTLGLQKQLVHFGIKEEEPHAEGAATFFLKLMK